MSFIPQLARSSKLLSRFMRASEDHIVDQFLKQPGFESLDLGMALGPAVFKRGTRKDAVLLVAHYDTVWFDQKDIYPRTSGSLMYSGCPGSGIGADDRAGCAALWLLRNTGHSILLVPEEETGCHGSSAFACRYSDRISDHMFAIQFDRRGSSDLVFYDCENEEFTEAMTRAYPGYAEAIGSFSDIGELCPAAGIAGVNVSIGFDNEHTEREILELVDWLRTVELTRRLLQRPCKHYKYVEGYRNWASYGRWKQSFQDKDDSKWVVGKDGAYHLVSVADEAANKEDSNEPARIDDEPSTLIVHPVSTCPTNEYYCGYCEEFFTEAEIQEAAHFTIADPTLLETCPACSKGQLVRCVLTPDGIRTPEGSLG